MSKISYNPKNLLKTAIANILQPIEDLALAKAIKEGEQTETVDRGAIFKALKKK